MIEVANTAMANSDIPVRFREFCIQEINIAESPSSPQRINDLINSRGRY